MAIQAVSVLGCGWLGLPFARRMAGLGYAVKGSTTTASKIPLLQSENIEPFLLTASPAISGRHADSFFQSDLILINIPFRRNLKDPAYYRTQITSVVSWLESSRVKFVLFASSTSVYPESLDTAQEDTPIVPANPRARVLRDVEQMLLENKRFETTVVRFAGLYGGERKIGKILAGRTGLSNGNSPVNLIHLEDCVEILVRVIQKDIRGEIFNACSDGHPTRKELYTKAAKYYGLKPPKFTGTEQIRRKSVSNQKLKKILEYTFIHPDPMKF